MENQYKILIIRILTIFILCFFHFGCQVQQDLEFERDIAPIVSNRCLSCHKEGGIAPIALDSPGQWKKYRKNIQIQIEAERMPPWPADEHYSTFIGQMCLRAGEKDTILRWLANVQTRASDASEDRIRIPETVRYYPEPDTLISFGQPVRLKGDGMDKFFLVSVPFDF